jgi:hypothetical protein
MDANGFDTLAHTLATSSTRRAGGAADRGASRGWTAHHPGPGRRPGEEAGNGGKGGNAKGSRGGTGDTGRKGKHRLRTTPTPKLATIHPIRPRSFGCPLGAAACLGVFAPIRERGAAMIVRAARTRLSPTWSGFAMPRHAPPCPRHARRDHILGELVIGHGCFRGCQTPREHRADPSLAAAAFSLRAFTLRQEPVSAARTHAGHSATAEACLCHAAGRINAPRGITRDPFSCNQAGAGPGVVCTANTQTRPRAGSARVELRSALAPRSGVAS